MAFDTSILADVRRRLNGDKPEEDVADTQAIPDFRASILFGNTSAEETTPAENNDQLEQDDDVPCAIRLPQLTLDESDFYKPTQVRDSHPETRDLTLGSTQVIARHTPENVLDDFDENTQELPEHIEKANQDETLAAELTHVSLMDEENELNDDADTTLDSSVQKTVATRARLCRIEQGLSEQNRLKNIQPGFDKQAINPMQQLFDAFDSDSDDTPAVNRDHGMYLSPTTSPVLSKVPVTKENDDMSADSDFELVDVMSLFDKEPKAPVQKKKLSPIEEYAEKLRKQLNSSPTGANEGMIVLDGSDAETDFESMEKTKIPDLTKEQAFILKQKFSKKHFQRTNACNSRFHKSTTFKSGNALFNELRRANAKQILALKENDPDSELIEEIEKEEEEMGSLLEREMERVRRIRKREKLHEKAQKALLDEKSDEDYDDAKHVADVGDTSEVPESEIDSDVPDSENENDSENNSENEKREDGEIVVSYGKQASRTHRAILSDNDDDDDDDDEKKQHLSSRSGTRKEERIDDSYMFGGQSMPNSGDESDGPVMQVYSDMSRPDSPVGSAIEQGVDNSNDLQKLFANLPPPAATQESSLLEPVEAERHDPVLFHETLSAQRSANETSLLATQVDGLSLNAVSTQDDRVVTLQKDAFSDGEDDDDIHFLLDKGRRCIRDNLHQTQENVPAHESEAEEEPNEEELKQKLALFEAKIKKKELQARKLRKEMERKGMKGIVEGEAEESDDEWKGVGGMDREESDQTDSEDERMIDNNFNIDLNDEELRKKFMEQYQLKDRHELEKLMDDIKNHRLTKRARSNRFDIELSDEEDEILMAYRRQKLEEQKQRLLENQKMMQSTKSEKSKAFFDCIQEEPIITILSESELSDSDLEIVEKEASPHHRSDNDNENDNINDGVIIESKPKKFKVLEESFVQRQLSFLSKTDEDDYVALQRASNIQHGVDDDNVEDVTALKKRCLSSLYSRPGSAQDIAGENRAPVEVLTDEDVEDFSLMYKKLSMVTSFRTHRDKHASHVSTTASFSGVTVNKQYKTASSSKASITYMSRQSRSKPGPALSIKSSKVLEIEARVDKVKLEKGFLGTRNGFA